MYILLESIEIDHNFKKQKYKRDSTCDVYLQWEPYFQFELFEFWGWFISILRCL